MKCIAVLDKDRKIVSAGYLDRPELSSSDYFTPRFGPVLDANQTLVEFIVPNEIAGMNAENAIRHIAREATKEK